MKCHMGITNKNNTVRQSTEKVKPKLRNKI